MKKPAVTMAQEKSTRSDGRDARKRYESNTVIGRTRPRAI